jgi:hypothetical protein
VPGQGNRRSVPAREATPAKPYVMIVLTDDKGDAIRPVENNQEDFDRRTMRPRCARRGRMRRRSRSAS